MQQKDGKIVLKDMMDKDALIAFRWEKLSAIYKEVLLYLEMGDWSSQTAE